MKREISYFRLFFYRRRAKAICWNVKSPRFFIIRAKTVKFTVEPINLDAVYYDFTRF